MEPSIHDLAKEWLRLDQDERTREEMENLVAENNTDELEKRLRHRIAFGTAGLRARMGAGFSRMNSLTVIQASQGLAEYLLANVSRTKNRGIVIGFDGRHNSKRFAKLAAAAFIAKDIKVWWYGVPVHTPLVSFGVGELRAVAGIMITASHNPPQDNGFKVYWEFGVQIIPPHDSGIAKLILQNLEPVSWDKHAVDNSLLVEGALNFVHEKYITAVQVAADPYNELASNVNDKFGFSYTAMHGVGLRAMTDAMNALGVESHMKVVQEQAHPDPDFPGLPFPNPEEKGALDVAIWSADRHNTSFILATDPDADRLAVAEKVDGIGWHIFTGNELGILLGSYIYDRYTQDKSKLAMIASTVSSKMLSVMAEREGFHFSETLTGFKWMGNKAISLDAEGYDSRFAFEEAIGYMIPGVCKDKDGVAAAAVFVCAAAWWQKSKGLSPYAKLQQLFKKYGYFEELNTYFISPSPTTTNEVFNSIRALGDPHPSKLGSHKVTLWRDLTKGWDSSTSDHNPTLPADPTSQMITCETESSVRLTIRSSGTEPKIKIYLECHSNHHDTARKIVAEVHKAIVDEWLKPEENNLKAPGT
jgi:phosphoglucomutase